MTDLTDRMRTCAAFFISERGKTLDELEHAMRDAADLLIEASNALEGAKPPLGELWIDIGTRKPIAPIADVPLHPIRMADASVDMTPTRPRACPKCGTHAANIAKRNGRKLMLACPVCAEEWEYKPQGIWI